MKELTKRKLKTTLFLVPSLILVLSFGVLSLTFDFAIRYQVRRLVSEKMQEVFTDFDDFYQSPNTEEAYLDISQEEELIILVHYLILDQNQKLVFSDGYWDLSQGQAEAESMARYFQKQNLPFPVQQTNELKLGQKTYAWQAKRYHGQYEGLFIVPSPELGVGQDYQVVVYTNISPIQEFLNVLRRIWLVLMVIAGGLSLIAILAMARRIENSLAKLKKYLWQVGKRKPPVKEPVLDYQEFNQLLQVVKDMARMIDQGEEVEKEFFQNASHELRTPLMSIQGYAEGIKAGVVPADKALDIIVKESQKMADLINEMLYLSRTMDTKPDMQDFDLSGLLDQCMDDIRGLGQGEDLALKAQIQAGLRFYGDEKRLGRAINNLLTNALRYAKSEIELGTKLDQGEILIWVKDDGPGILEEDLAHIFKRFYKGKGGKFGIGLALAKELIEDQGGRIQVATDRSGACFTIRLGDDRGGPGEKI